MVSLRRAKGRCETAPFHQMPSRLLRSRCWWSLSSKAVKLFWDVYEQYNGFNNGDLSMTWNQMKCRGWKSKDTIYKAMDELVCRGLIVKTRQGGKHRPSLYAVTIQAIDDCQGKHDIPATNRATHDWRNWKPDSRGR